MSTSPLLQRLRANRQAWLELDDTRSVLVQRPAETQMLAMRHGVSLQDAAAAVVDWRGFTEAGLVGAKLGSDSPVPFAADLWAEWVADNLAAANAVAAKVASMVQQHLAAKDEAAKN